MKALIITSILLASTLAQASFYITCESANQWNSSAETTPPLGAGEVWSIKMKGNGNAVKSGNNLSESYDFKMTKFKNGQIVAGPYQVKSILTEYNSSGYSSLSFSLPNATSPYESGRFTISHLLNPYSSDPFVMYGWSKMPLTVTPAMNYICKIQGVY